ncbi:MAG TPA: FHA domain-containing protein [Sandaracinaceae bacterium LLY-WYZ-13_1]|nr:FHA domain-containing protein [Sandaracinaceae bacterium LLY-WYZ-13_1]
MGEPPWPIGALIERVRREGIDAVRAACGPFVLVGSTRTEGEAAWSFATQAAVSPLAGAEARGFDLDHAIALPLRKRGRTFADTVLIGRSRSNDVVVEDGTVSKLHARARLDEGSFWLADAGSRNGTFLDGERLDGEEIEVFPADTVRFGSCTFRVHRGASFCDLLSRLGASADGARG